MEASYIVFLLRPHHANFKKRLVKTPKLYFYDVGLVSWLLGIRTPEHITNHPLRGALFETFILSELLKSRMNKGEQPSLFFWRDSNGNEVNVIEEQGGKLHPIEIKSGKTLSTESTAGLKKWLKLAQEKGTSPTLIYGGDESYRSGNIQITSWQKSSDLFY